MVGEMPLSNADVVVVAVAAGVVLLALAWVLQRGNHIVCIPGTTKQSRFDENQAANNVALTAEELAFLAVHLPVGAAAGGRY